MQALELLTSRSSMPKVVAPGPTPEQLQLMLQAASRAPDHLQLMPYRFHVFSGKGLQRLSDIFAEAAAIRGQSEAQQELAQQLPKRAPMVIAVCLRWSEHDKVPRDEQFATAACATLLLQQAAFAQGLGAIWRTGWFAEDSYVMEQLECSEDDAIVGFLYVGTPAVTTPVKPDKDISSHIQYIEN